MEDASLWTDTERTEKTKERHGPVRIRNEQGAGIPSKEVIDQTGTRKKRNTKYAG